MFRLFRFVDFNNYNLPSTDLTVKLKSNEYLALN